MIMLICTKKLSNTVAELKKSIAHKKGVYIKFNAVSHCILCVKTDLDKYYNISTNQCIGILPVFLC